jgi:Flp pilus assembly protein TadG
MSSKSRKTRSLSKEHGQSVVEVAITLPFLLLIILALVQMGILFASYVALVNAAREGAIYASMHPELSDAVKTPDGSATWEEYQNRVLNEVSIAVGSQLYEGQLVTTQYPLTADRPAVGSTCTTVGCPITSTVHYNFQTFLNGMSVPGFDFALPKSYQINYSLSMPIR